MLSLSVYRLETLPETMSKACQYLGVVLRGEVRLEYAQLLLKMMIINLFSVHHAAEYSGRTLLTSTQLLPEGIAVIMGFPVLFQNLWGTTVEWGWDSHSD